MVRILLLAVGGVFLGWLGMAGVAAAQTAEENTEAEVKAVRPVGEALLKNRISDLERRMSQLEDEIRFLDERTRNLDRRIDDLRQRH